jgi:hypothetical protein
MIQNVIRTVRSDGSKIEKIYVYYDGICDVVLFYDSSIIFKHKITKNCIGAWNVNFKTKK